MNLDQRTLVYENDQFEIHNDPREPEGYVMIYTPKSDANSGYFQFPRGTMQEIARLDNSEEAFGRMKNLLGNVPIVDSAFFSCDALLTMRSAMDAEEREFKKWEKSQNN